MSIYKVEGKIWIIELSLNGGKGAIRRDEGNFFFSYLSLKYFTREKLISLLYSSKTTIYLFVLTLLPSNLDKFVTGGKLRNLLLFSSN